MNWLCWFKHRWAEVGINLNYQVTSTPSGVFRKAGMEYFCMRCGKTKVSTLGMTWNRVKEEKK